MSRKKKNRMPNTAKAENVYSDEITKMQTEGKTNAMIDVIAKPDDGVSVSKVDIPPEPVQVNRKTQEEIDEFAARIHENIQKQFILEEPKPKQDKPAVRSPHVKEEETPDYKVPILAGLAAFLIFLALGCLILWII